MWHNNSIRILPQISRYNVSTSGAIISSPLQNSKFGCTSRDWTFSGRTMSHPLAGIMKLCCLSGIWTFSGEQSLILRLKMWSNLSVIIVSWMAIIWCVSSLHDMGVHFLFICKHGLAHQSGCNTQGIDTPFLFNNDKRVDLVHFDPTLNS